MSSFSFCSAVSASLIAFKRAFSSFPKAIIWLVTSFCLVNLCVSKSINLAFKLASSSKSALVDLPNAFSACFASNLNLAAAISLLVISCSNSPASLKNPIRSCIVNFSLLTAFSNKSALSLFAFARSTINFLSTLSAFALWSAICAAILASSFNSFTNDFVDSVTLSKVFLTPVKLSTKLLPAFLASCTAPLKSPLNTFLNALPKKPNVSSIALNLFVIFSLIKFLKSIIACLGFSNTDIIFSPKSANKSNKLPVTLPITPNILANLFCPSSLLVNA